MESHATAMMTLNRQQAREVVSRLFDSHWHSAEPWYDVQAANWRAESSREMQGQPRVRTRPLQPPLSVCETYEDVERKIQKFRDEITEGGAAAEAVLLRSEILELPTEAWC